MGFNSGFKGLTAFYVTRNAVATYTRHGSRSE